jgi:membrane protease YdiL (CAAX protease family)
LRQSVGWLKIGRLDGYALAAVAVITTVSCSGLVLWFVLFRPDVSDLAEFIPRWPPIYLLLAGAGFAILNALLEEVIWRGVMQDAFAVQFGPTWAVLAQAVGFGVLHAHGFPRGLAGMVMATIYGLMLGDLRRRVQGVAAPVIAHVGADTTIFAIVVWSARYASS